MPRMENPLSSRAHRHVFADCKERATEAAVPQDVRQGVVRRRHRHHLHLITRTCGTVERGPRERKNCLAAEWGGGPENCAGARKVPNGAKDSGGSEADSLSRASLEEEKSGLAAGGIRQGAGHG